MGAHQVTVHVENHLGKSGTLSAGIGGQAELGPHEPHRFGDLVDHPAQPLPGVVDQVVADSAVGDERPRWSILVVDLGRTPRWVRRDRSTAPRSARARSGSEPLVLPSAFRPGPRSATRSRPRPRIAGAVSTPSRPLRSRSASRSARPTGRRRRRARRRPTRTATARHPNRRPEGHVPAQRRPPAGAKPSTPTARDVPGGAGNPALASGRWAPASELARR